MLADSSADTLPDFVAIGHATRDLLPGGGWRLGGSVAFASLTASRLGMHAAVLTSCTPDVLRALQETLPDVDIRAVPSPEATIFENIYTGGVRRQFLRGRALPLELDAVPDVWRAAPVILLAPLAGEIGPELAAALSRSPTRLLAATPQGWLRRIDSAGAVSAVPFDLADKILPHLGAMILSFEDIRESPADFSSGQNETLELLENRHSGHTILSGWLEDVPLIAVTRGAAGAVLYQRSELPREFPGYPAREVDPTGAGDVFAAAFLVQLYKTGDAGAAMDFANRVAACSVESVGVGGIPTYATAVSRFGISNIGS